MKLLLLLVKSKFILFVSLYSKFCLHQIAVLVLVDQVRSGPAPQRRRGRRPPPRGYGGYYGRPPPPRNNNNFVDNILPLKVAGGVGLAGGFALSQFLNGK